MPIPSKINPDLEKERSGASFDPNEFAAWFYDGENKLQMKRLIENELYPNLDFDAMDLEYMSYEDAYTEGVKHSTSAAKTLMKMQERINPGGNEIYPTCMGGPIGECLIPLGNVMGVHTVMFTRALKGQGHPALYEKYGRRAEKCEILGSYCQTELGHGTFLRGLETTAHYDRTTDEFILNTPKLTSYKWWPGGLGQTVNYCIVVAQLFIDNESKGIQLFLVQVRDEETFAPLPGLDLGDIGKKFGLPGVNNGYLGMKNVRIPRENMLMKNAKVLPGGQFIQSPVAQLNYFPMIFVRCAVAINNSLLLAKCATIATRYSAVRRQSPINPDEPEPQVMDHVTQQLKVFPEIATAIAYRLASGHLWKLYYETSEHLENSDFSRLPELHALACTLKASCSYDSSAGIERLRLSCGGHGYLVAANLSNMYTVATAACTYEGENSVLYMQVGKILLKSWKTVLEGKQLMPTLHYLTECSKMSEFPKWTGTWECMVKALQYVTANKTRIAHHSYMARLKQGQIEPVAVNNTAIELTQAAELHGRSFVSHTFLQETTGSSAAQRSAELNGVLQNLLELYLIQTVFRHMADILRFIRLSDDHITALQNRLELLLTKIRPDAVAIVDGFDFHDRALGSVLGAYDGNVYERLYESAQKSPLNKQIVPKAFHLHLKPFMKSNI